MTGEVINIVGQDSQGVHKEELHILSFFIITLTAIATPSDTTLTFSTSIIFIISTMIFIMILIHCQIISVNKKDQTI